MKKPSVAFHIVDALLLAGMLLPLIAGIALSVMFTPASEGISVTGPLIYFTVSLPFQDLPVSESQVNSALVLCFLLFLSLFLTHGLTPEGGTKRQHLAEMLVEFTDNLVKTNMGEYFAAFSPFVGSILLLSACSSLLSLLGLYAPTSDLNIVAGWAILVFFLITYFKMKCGPINYLKSFTQPLALMTPMNVISEVATPVSMAFRHFGNVLSGSVISILLAAALQGVSKMVFGWLPAAVIDRFPILQVGIPGVLSIYFDVFSGILQAYIFSMLTMLYVSGAFDLETWNKRKAKKDNKNKIYT